MAFCGNCGTQMQDGVKFCTACGKENGGALTQQAGESSLTLTVSGKTFKFDTVFKAISSVLIALSFVFPYYRVTGRVNMGSMYSASVSWVSMFSSIFSGDGRSFPALLAFIVPVAILLMFIFKRKLTFLAGKLLLAAAGLCALGIIFSIAFMSVTDSVIRTSRPGASVHAALTFFVAMLLYLVGIGIAVHGMKASKNK